ncbi:hypothetical protein [Marinobacter sp. M-5]|uniref:hypothetical protein n=1 Tax=Marinobacter sp. M-5 TaxID=3081089 RepID=UPI00293CFE0F|nr:hypothetical protein [Marinobacter sp. M-5]MDV3504220.1 hypothetical protein [Marinobacter sp. M-5]
MSGYADDNDTEPGQFFIAPRVAHCLCRAEFGALTPKPRFIFSFNECLTETMREHQDDAPLIFQAVDKDENYEIRVLVKVDGKLAVFSREGLNRSERDAILSGEMQLARTLWMPEGNNLNDQVHWCVSSWRRQGFAYLVRNDRVFLLAERRLASRGGDENKALTVPTGMAI